MEENVPTRRGFFGAMFVSATVAVAPNTAASATPAPQTQPETDVWNLYPSSGNYYVAPPVTFRLSDSQKLMALRLHEFGYMRQSDLFDFIGVQR